MRLSVFEYEINKQNCVTYNLYHAGKLANQWSLKWYHVVWSVKNKKIKNWYLMGIKDFGYLMMW